MTDKQKFIRPIIRDRSPQDRQHIRLSYITHYYFDQRSPATLLNLLDRYSSYNQVLLDQIQFVVVDDCSPLHFEIPEYDLNIIWLRITDNIPWNQGGARNLGMTYAGSDKALVADLDLEFPEHTLDKMVRMRNPGRHFYKIRRKNKETGEFGSGHPNTFLLSRGRFFRLYGYDEEYSGGYGAEDYRFVKFQKYHGSWQHNLSKKYFCYARTEIDRNKSYHSLRRTFDRNTPIDNRKRNELLLWGGEAGHSRMFLNFRWEIVLHHARANKILLPSKRWWKHLWWFRTLFGTYK